MAEPTFQEVFGAGATQTATTITILKADLDLTATATNRGEQCFAAICKKASVNLTAANLATNADQSISVVPSFESLIYRTINNVQTTFLQTPLTVNFVKVQASSGVTPNDY
jgi:Tfp pilus assembly protein PilX